MRVPYKLLQCGPPNRGVGERMFAAKAVRPLATDIPTPYWALLKPRRRESLNAFHISQMESQAPSEIAPSGSVLQGAMERRRGEKAPLDIPVDLRAKFSSVDNIPFWLKSIKKEKEEKASEQRKRDSVVHHEINEGVHLRNVLDTSFMCEKLTEERESSEGESDNSDSRENRETINSLATAEDGDGGILIVTPRGGTEGLKTREDVGHNLISELKLQAHEIAKVNELEGGGGAGGQNELHQVAKYYPGIDAKRREDELTALSRYSLEDLFTAGYASTENVNALIQAKAKMGDFKSALHMYDEMKVHGLESDVDTFVGLIQAAGMARDPASARSIFLKLRSQMLTPNLKVYTSLMHAHVISGDLLSAFSLLRKCEDEGLVPDVVAYTTLLNGLMNEGKVEEGRRLFNEVRTWKGIQPDPVMMTVMMKGCVEGKEAERAVNILDDMRASAMHPTDVTYSTLIDVLSRRHDFVKECFHYYNQMIAERMPIPSSVYLSLLRSCSTCGHLALSRNVIMVMRRASPPVPITREMYPLMILTFGNAMRLENASDQLRLKYVNDVWRLVQHMMKREEMTTELLNSLVSMYSLGGFAQSAVDMLLQFDAFKCQPDTDTFAPLLEMFGRDLRDPGRFFQIWDKLKEMSPQRPTAHLLRLALDTGMLSKSATSTLSVLKEMYELKVYPSPPQAEKLAIVGRHIPEVTEIVHMLIDAQRLEVAAKSEEEHRLQMLRADEAALRLAQIGKCEGESTLYQRVSKEEYKANRAFRKRHGIPRPIEQQEEIEREKAKGGPLYAERVELPIVPPTL